MVHHRRCSIISFCFTASCIRGHARTCWRCWVGLCHGWVLQVQPRLVADLGLDLNPQSRAVKPVAALTYQVGMSYLALHGVLAVACLHTALQKPSHWRLYQPCLCLSNN